MSRRDPRDDRRRREPDREPTRERTDRPGASRPTRASLNDFFVNGEGIHREVLQREICKYLGPEAYSRPTTYNGVQGFLVTAVRPFTPKMLDDLQELSDAYVLENREMTRRGHQGIPYGESETSRRQDAMLNRMEEYPQDRYQSQLPYSTMATAQPGYPALSGPGYPQAQPGVYPGSAYPPGGNYPPNSNYSTQPGYPPMSSGTRPGPDNSYMYRDESPRANDYRQPSAYPGPGGAPQLRDPRPDPRPDPRYASIDARDLRLDSRDPRDLRAPDPRTNPGYPSYVTSPGDVQMHDDSRYEYVSVPGGRGAPYPSSRVMQSGVYDPRETPQMRDPYRNEPIREERRRR